MTFTRLMMVFMLVDLLALGENFIRHLDEFGASAEVAGFFFGWNWLYRQYETVNLSYWGSPSH